MGAWDVVRRVGGARWLALGLACAGIGLGARAEGASPKGDPALGKELFAREWLPGDARSHGGDGLGPVYNDSSCVACHNLGGPGGGGPTGKNADIISAFPNQVPRNLAPREPGFLRKAVASLVGAEEPKAAAAAATPRPPRADELIKLHAGFRTARSLVLHRFGTDESYEAWRLGMTGMGGFASMGGGFGPRGQAEQEQIKNLMRFGGRGTQRGQSVQAGEFTVVRSQRNPTALFGAGLIDAIPDEALEAAARATFADAPEIKGRVARQKDGRIGRFGWKGQTPSLDDFVRTACAVELGLESPRHHQAGLPTAAEKQPKGLDLTDEECDAIVAYLRDLPAPVERAPSGPKEAEALAAGKALFASTGCASCHTPKLGQVAGLYSDLLLHDMGQDLGDVGEYGVFDPNSTAPEVVDPAETAAASPAPDPARPPAAGATRVEWRTPPLWGLRDSGPYLHDGRAETIEEAIALHGGQAANSARKYFGLSYEEKQSLQAFLKSLAAPAGSAELARADR